MAEIAKDAERAAKQTHKKVKQFMTKHADKILTSVATAVLTKMVVDQIFRKNTDGLERAVDRAGTQVGLSIRAAASRLAGDPDLRDPAPYQEEKEAGIGGLPGPPMGPASQTPPEIPTTWGPATGAPMPDPWARSELDDSDRNFLGSD